jgi:hypothetical protein
MPNDASANQVFLSLSLAHAIDQGELSPIRYFYLAKIFYLEKVSAEILSQIFVGNVALLRIVKALLNLIRIALIF